MAEQRFDGGPVGKHGPIRRDVKKSLEGLPQEPFNEARALLRGQAVQHQPNQRVPGEYGGKRHHSHPTTPKAPGQKE